MQQLQGLPPIKKLIITVLHRLRRGAAGRSRLLANTSLFLLPPASRGTARLLGLSRTPGGAMPSPWQEPNLSCTAGRGLQSFVLLPQQALPARCGRAAACNALWICL